MLLRSVYLSLDPYMHCASPWVMQKSYADPVAIDEVMVGATVCQVEASNSSNYEVGEWVLAYTGWQRLWRVERWRSYQARKKRQLILLTHWASWACQAFTAYMGLLDIGQPKEGDTLVVAAATGPVGATVGQIR